MACDMVVALKQASANGATLFGLNHHADPRERHRVHLVRGMTHDAGALAMDRPIRVPQVRQTSTVLGIQKQGDFGYVHGVNEHGVAIGGTSWQSRLGEKRGGLSGPDLMRLTLERCHSAHHAVEVLTDLLEHFGEQCGDDTIYLIADASEAFVLETTGRFWALLECGHSRVVTDTAMIRQDWARLSRGLASHVIGHGWWQDDGSKIDFVRCLSTATDRSRNAQKRWGRASLALAQQQGAIDAHFLRRMLSDHYTTNREMLPDAMRSLACSALVELPAREQPIILWVAFGPPSVAVYFPLCLSGELPAAFCEGVAGSTSIEEKTHDLWRLARGTDKDRTKLNLALERLQTKFDQDVESLLARQERSNDAITQMMHDHVAGFDKEYRRLFGVPEPAVTPTQEAEEVLFFA